MSDYQLKSCGRKDLGDNGVRDLDEEICLHLDNNYQNWRNPETTYMVPPVFISKMADPDVGEITEKEFYYLLQEFGEKHSEPMFVIHSYRFSECIHEWESGTKRRPKWIMGEHDFVVVHRRYGVLFFQVKSSKRKSQNVLQKAEEQIYKDKVSLQKFLERMEEAKKVFKKNVEKQVFDNFPAFIVLPNSPGCHLGPSSRSNVIYQESCSNVEAFSAWWNKFVSNPDQPEMDETIFHLLVKRYVGMVHVSPLTGTCVDKCEKTLLFKTTEQVKILADHFSPELWIRGPAGSGKTFLLLEKAETVASDIIDRRVDEKILVLCFNSVLCMDLDAKLSERLAERFYERRNVRSVIDFKTFAKLITESADLPEFPSTNQQKEQAVFMALERLKQKTSPFYGKYDHVFVDEGQDLYGTTMWPELLKKMHKSSVDEDAEQGYLWVMYDANQYLYFAKDKQDSLGVYLKNSAPLNKVLRNTQNVFNQSSKYFESLMPREKPITLGHQEAGLKIEWDASWAKERVQAIVKHVKELQRQKVQARDICVLVENKEKRNAVMNALQSTNKKGHHRLKSQTADELVTAKRDLVVVESVRRFKGLESKVVILYNPPFKDEPAGNKELLYTAMSRCVCYLIIITTQEGCKALQSDKGIQVIPPYLGKRFGEMPEMAYSFEEVSPQTTQSSNKRLLVVDDGKDVTHLSPPKISRKEEEQIVQLYAMRQKPNAARTLKVPGCDLLEPGDEYIKDSIRQNAFKLLGETVEQNLKFMSCSGNMNQSSRDVTSVVARIEHEAYNKRRKELNSKYYTKDLRNLKREIQKCNTSQTSHEEVVKACTDSS